MGDDAAVVQMARTSYGAGTKTVSTDEALIRYLMRHHHTSPFEGAVAKFHIKCPILVARQLLRHRTASVNEISARYSELPEDIYLPDLERFQEQSTDNKQGSGQPLTLATQEHLQTLVEESNRRAYAEYQALLDAGLAREIARTVLPVGIYTEFYYMQDLHNLLHMLRLRMHEHAQKETRLFANQIGKIVAEWVPSTWGAFEDYRLNAVTFTAPEIKVLREMLNETERGDALANGLPRRERDEFYAKIRGILQ